MGVMPKDFLPKHQMKQLAACQRKAKYSDPVSADLAIAELWAEKKRDLVKYYCNFCYGWHLASGKWNLRNC